MHELVSAKKDLRYRYRRRTGGFRFGTNMVVFCLERQPGDFDEDLLRMATR